MGLIKKILWPIELKFIKKRNEAGDTYTFSFKPIKDFSWEAGQYMDYYLGTGLVKHFTIASSPKEEIVNITTKILPEPSKFKNRLLSLRKNENILARNPRGNLKIENNDKKCIFIAGGIGITPFRAIIWDQIKGKNSLDMVLLYANTVSQIPFKKELDKISKQNKNIKIKYFIEPQRISIDDIFEHKDDNSTYFIAGPPKMVDFYQKKLKEIGINDKKIKSDPFWGY